MSKFPLLSRRQFHAALLSTCWGAVRVGTAFSAASETARKPFSGIVSIEHQGVFINECTLPGQTRKDDVVPRQGNCIQVSRDRWLMLYATHGFRGVDDERSIVYQLRRGSPDSPVIREGFLARDQSDWDALGDGGKSAGEGKCYFKQHGHIVAFGVPKGALIHGQPARNANVFMAKWRTLGRILDKKQNFLIRKAEFTLSDLTLRTQNVECVQFRLNDREDDIELLQPVRPLRQKGFEEGKQFCSAVDAGWMNQSFVPAVPFNVDGTEWVDCNHFGQYRLAVLKYRFNPQLGLYEWVEMGPFIRDPSGKRLLSEASLARVDGRWIIGGRVRNGKGVGWISTENPFAPMPEPTFPENPGTTSPISAFCCPDGVLRLFGTDSTISPYHNTRDPLYCWEIDPQRGFTASEPRIIFDTVAARLPFRPEVEPKADFCKLLPSHGRTQLLIHSVCTRAYNLPHPQPQKVPAVSAEEKAHCALYYARITWREPAAARWQF